MNTLVFVGLFGLFCYHCKTLFGLFKGSSKFMGDILYLAGNVGQLVFYGLTIWSFWHFSWWQVVIMYILETVLSGFSAVFVQRNTIAIFACPVLAVVFAILSIIGLINAG